MVYMCKNGIRIVGIDNVKKGVFVYGTRREATIEKDFIDTATSLTHTTYPTNDCYTSVEVNIN